MNEDGKDDEIEERTSDREIRKIDVEERRAKYNQKFEKPVPTHLVGSVNDIAEQLSCILAELRRLNDVVEYLAPISNDTKDGE